MLRWLLIAVALIVALALVDRLLLAAESRGWVRYRNDRPSRRAASTAVLSVMSIYEPGHHHVVEQRRTTSVDEDADDEPLEPHGSPPGQPPP